MIQGDIYLWETDMQSIFFLSNKIKIDGEEKDNNRKTTSGILYEAPENDPEGDPNVLQFRGIAIQRN